jgi:hypothetical protein
MGNLTNDFLLGTEEIPCGRKKLDFLFPEVENNFGPAEFSAVGAHGV